ncbi:ELKS/Rab6-interacting/CAST family member 1 isoform X2 [Astyanax mexicanus]|uniref:ELKS/Rab6-interacting/CAST family member 1 isoform X2 n=1 Tax=Astyanax mexicanus TaxID=7994 RepID=UPI000BBD5B7F|nr:ELKS/Rab6-interacting/CAST family member 1 isoform X2 [Astyanax mexicanus]
MEDQTGLTGLDNLLLQLALETRELSQKKEELKQQIQIYRSSIQTKKQHIEETQKNIKKLDEEISQKQKTVKCFKENVKSLRGTNNLLLQYEKTLESELERRQDSCNQDMKLFQERIDNYRNVFQQYKEEYCKNPLAKQLLKFQAENEEMEKRIRAKEEEMIAKEKVLNTLKEDHSACESGERPSQSQDAALPPESDFQPQADTAIHDELPPQGTEAEQDILTEMEEKTMEKKEDQADGFDASNASQVGALGSTVWTKPDLSCDLIQEAQQKQQEQAADVDFHMNTSFGPDVMEEMMKGMEVEDQQEHEEAVDKESTNEGAAPSSPVRMSAALNTPTFSLNSSPSTSPGRRQSSEGAAFVFSVHSDPSTPGFSGFGCNFDVGSNPSEESPLKFTSPYFSSKKSPETKLPGFLFDEMEGRQEEEFAFSFGAKSPQPSTSSQEEGGTGDPFPFSFSFGKF